MNGQQNSTEAQIAAEFEPAIKSDVRYSTLVDFKALGGLITDEEGIPHKRSMQWLADLMQVDRATLYNWMKVDGFWDDVNTRRVQITPKSRLAQIHNVWYLSALKGGSEGFRDRQLWLANFDPNFRMPTEKVEVEAGNSWAALMEQHKNDAIDVKPDVIEIEDSTATVIQEAEVIPSVGKPESN